MSDLDWAELADMSGTGIHPDQLRKMGAGIRLVMDAGMLSLEGNNQNHYDLQKMRDLRNEINMNCRSEARSEALREAVIEAAGNLRPIQVHTFSDPYRSIDRSLVVAIGDFHYGAEWKVHGLCGEILNEYNPEVFEYRMEQLLVQITEILDKESLTHVDLLICGDTLDGMLRASQ